MGEHIFVVFLFKIVYLLLFSCVTKGSILQRLLEENDLDPMYTANITFKQNLRQKLLYAYLSPGTFTKTKLSEMDFAINNYSLKVSQVKLAKISKTYISRVDANLLMRNIDLKAEWSYVVISADYEQRKVNDSDSYKNQLQIYICGIQMSGLVGLKTEEDKMQTSNFNIKIKLDEPSLNVPSISLFKNAITNALEREVKWNFEQLLKQQLDNILKEISLDTIFKYNKEALERFRSSSSTWNSLTNKIMDSLIRLSIEAIKRRKMNYINLPNITKTFAVKVMFITYWGKLKMFNSTVGDFSTLKRISDCSLFGNLLASNVLTNVGLDKLNFYVPHYSVSFLRLLGTSGVIKATTTDIAFSLSVNISISIWSAKAYVGGAKMTISNMGPIRVHITGLTFLFNWLFSLMTTLLVNTFDRTIVLVAETSLNKMLQEILINKEVSFFG